MFNLGKTRSTLFKSIRSVFGKKVIDEDTLGQLEEALIATDIDYPTVEYLLEQLQKKCSGELSQAVLLSTLQECLLELIPTSENLNSNYELPNGELQVILVLGVNGVGKTTSVAKLAHYYQQKGKKVLVAAADTFRAGAIDQLNEWCQSIGVDIIKQQEGSAASAVVYSSYEAAKSRGTDILLIDTAGRLHNKIELMSELNKLVLVLKKHGEHLPHQSWLVIDGNTGQNAILQAQAFNKVCPLTGLVVTKLDGTSKGGAIITICQKLKVPVKWVGVGEKVEDLMPFDAKLYVSEFLSND